jgi:hypothetical protein
MIALIAYSVKYMGIAVPVTKVTHPLLARRTCLWYSAFGNRLILTLANDMSHDPESIKREER